jgi:hypothetical protein
MATQSNRLDKASPPKLGRRFRSGLKSSNFGPNAAVPVLQRSAASRALNTPKETNSSQSRIAQHAENAGLRHHSDSKHALNHQRRNEDVSFYYFLFRFVTRARYTLGVSVS